MKFEDCPDDPTKVRIKMNEYFIPKPWVGLTDEEIFECAEFDDLAYARKIEALLKEKNHG